MTRPAARPLVLGLLVATTALGACSSWRTSGANPSNWFGRSRAAEVSPAEFAGQVNPLMPDTNSAREFQAGEIVAIEGVAINQILSLEIERTISGAIIRADGLATRQGAYDARLIPDTFDEVPVDGVLSYRFVVKYPEGPAPVGDQATRTISVARSVTHEHLANARLIRVSGIQNAREAGRR